MVGFIGEDQVRQIKEANDLVAVMSDYAPPVKSGYNFKVCCPFHQERTPSCVLYVDQQTYHCFGCGAHGDVITLVREKEGFDFAEAVETLARRAGIEVTFEERGGRGGLARSERDSYLEAMGLATAFYEQCLWRESGGAEARAYLAERGLDEEVCRRFRIGWAPGGGRLVELARGKGLAPTELVTVNLAFERDGRFTDRFYKRVMFPVCDRRGSPIAFSGRLLPAAERAAKEEGRGVGKYINSSETPLYHKSSVVYNLHQARRHCRDAGRILVMEGPTDVMAADRVGIGECVAVMGTAFTPDHARQLGNVIGDRGRVILLFDGDSAGQSKMIAGLKSCLATGIPARVALLPEGMDPAETLALPGGRAEFDQALSQPVADIVHLMRSLAPQPYAIDHRERLAAVDEILACLRQLADNDLRSAYLGDVAAYFDLAQDRLARRLREGAGDERRPRRFDADDEPPEPVAPPLDPPREVVLQVLTTRPELRDRAFDEWGLEPCLYQQPWRLLVEMMLEDPDRDLDGLLLDQQVRSRSALVIALNRWRSRESGPHGLSLADPEQLVSEHLVQVRREGIASEASRLQAELRTAQQAGETERASELFRRWMEVQRQAPDSVET